MENLAVRIFPQKILFISEAMLGGVRQHVFDVIYGLNKKWYDIYLAYSDNRADDKFFKEIKDIENIGVHLIRCKHMQRELHFLSDMKAIWELQQIIKTVNPDIVHCHSSKAGYTGRMASFICGVKKVYYTPHAYSFQNPCLSKIKRWTYIESEKILSRYMTTKTINISKGEMQEALRCNVDNKNKFILIYNGIDEVKLPSKKFIREKNGFTEEQILIGVNARLTEQKDPMTFLMIAERVIKEEDKAYFIYCGDGEMEEQVKDWVSTHQLKDRILLPGFRDDTDTLVSMFDIYLSTALYEGMPYSLLEALRAGIPVIATDVTGNNELVVENENGMLFPARDVQKGVDLCIRQIRYKLIKKENVIKSFNERFSSKTMINNLESLFGGKHDAIKKVV